jgi:3-hydroxyacyl-CoA dehydrogenase / enoyl-CoA hydratase / 3-hydroxybutyryl-CoA epimerase
MDALRLEVRPDGVAVIRFDSPGTHINILSRAFFDEFRGCLDRIEADSSIRACVLSSAKSDSFIAGANLKEFLAMKEASEGEAFSRAGHALLDRVAASKKPFVAAIHGPALGGGLEVALACAYRLATDDSRTLLGLPEVTLGLLPGGGGTERLPALIGLTRALPMLLTGKRLRAREALRAGLVDALTSPGGLVETAATAALRLSAGTLRRRLVPKSAMDRIAAFAPVRAVLLSRVRAQVLQRTRGLHQAPLFILDCIEARLTNGRAAGQEKESVLFGLLAASPECKNLIALFEGTTALKGAGSKGDVAQSSRRVKRVAVLGAGLMGEGIAAVSLPLVPVILRDVSDKALAKAAKNLSRGLDRRLRSGGIGRLDRSRHWSNLHPATSMNDIAGCDLVIEAVFEDLDLKRRVLKEAEELIAPGAIYASNTSALPIGLIAQGALHPERILGMHYFSPVPKMPLLELVVTPQSAPEAIATARSFGIAQGKTVIVVRDGPGFYTTRILSPYLNEAMLLLEEGAGIAEIDAALRDFGFPIGPLALLDEVGIDVGAHVSQEMSDAFPGRGLAPPASLRKLVEAGWLGRKSGRGFYLYPPDAGKRSDRPVNPELAGCLGLPVGRKKSAQEITDRLVLLFVNEAIHCLGEGVIASARDGDVGAVLGLGFPPFRGGPFRYADALGVTTVLSKLDDLSTALGVRFRPALALLRSAVTGAGFHTPSGPPFGSAS